MSRKNFGWILIIASFILAEILIKVGFFGDIIDIILLAAGALIVWQENGKSAARKTKDPDKE
jgi:hypothetical protein